MLRVIDLEYFRVTNSQIILEHKFFVLTSRILSGTCSLEDNSSKVTIVSAVSVLSPEPRSSFRRLTWKIGWISTPSGRARQ